VNETEHGNLASPSASNTVEESPPASDDDALVSRSQAGDRSAFDELVLRYQDRIYRLVAHMVRRKEDAFDVAQECFVKAYRGLSEFRGDAAFSTWLYRIAIHTATSHQRRMAARMQDRHVSIDAARHNPGTAHAAELAASTPGPDEAVDRSEQRRLVRRAIQALDHEYRVVVLLRDMEGRTYDEIGELLQCPLGTVKSRLHRAREQLREALAPIIAPEQHSEKETTR